MKFDRKSSLFYICHTPNVNKAVANIPPPRARTLQSPRDITPLDLAPTVAIGTRDPLKVVVDVVVPVTPALTPTNSTTSTQEPSSFDASIEQFLVLSSFMYTKSGESVSVSAGWWKRKVAEPWSKVPIKKWRLNLEL